MDIWYSWSKDPFEYIELKIYLSPNLSFFKQSFIVDYFSKSSILTVVKQCMLRRKKAASLKEGNNCLGIFERIFLGKIFCRALLPHSLQVLVWSTLFLYSLMSLIWVLIKFHHEENVSVLYFVCLAVFLILIFTFFV